MAKSKNKKNSNKNSNVKQTKKEFKKIKLDVKGSKETEELTNIVKYLLIVVIIFVIVYFLTAYITNHSSNSDYKKQVPEATIQSDKILAGSTFKQKNDEYYVLFYNVKDDVSYTETYNNYKAKEENHLPIYYVDTNEGLNRSYVGEEINENPSEASELKINGVTLIRIKDGEVEEYITNTDEINEKLS